MVVEVLCPICGAVFNLKPDYLGKKVRCKKCEHAFTVGGDKARESREDEGVSSKSSAAAKKKSDEDDDDERSTSRKGGAAAKRGRDDDDGDDDYDRPRRKRSRAGRDDDDDDDDGGRKRKRVYHGDEDDDDDDRPRQRAPESSGGGAGKVLIIIGGVVALLVLLCGGGIYGIYRVVNATGDAIDDQDMAVRNDLVGDAFGGMELPGMDRQPKDFEDALASLKSDKPFYRRGAANWLAKQPLNPARQQEVAQAVEPLVKGVDVGCIAAGARALRVWGTQDNGPALATALRQRPTEGIQFDAAKELMATIGKLKYAPGADAVTRFLPNFLVGADAERALDELGPGAEPEVLKLYHHPNQDCRDKGRRLLTRYGTKSVAILDQTVSDLGSPEKDRAKNALDWLAADQSNDALRAANADPARRTAVAVALNPHIDNPPPFGGDNAVSGALKRWATKENTASIIRNLKTRRNFRSQELIALLGQMKDPSAIPGLVELVADSFNRQAAGDALIAIGPACRDEVTKLLSHKDAFVRAEAERILGSIGGGKGDFKIVRCIEDLKSGEFRRLDETGRYLQTARVDEAKQAEVVEAALFAMSNASNKTDAPLVEVAKAVVVWAKKEDAAAILDKVKELDRSHCRKTRHVMLEWLGKQKFEKAILYLVACLPDNDDRPVVSKALQGMGPEFGSAIELEVLKIEPGLNKALLLAQIKILGAVGTKTSLKPLTTQKVRSKSDLEIVTACDEAIVAINARNSNNK